MRLSAPPHTRDSRVATDIKFVGVARALDRTIVASLTVQKQDVQDQYHTAVREVLGAPDFTAKVTPGARYRLVGDVNAFNFTTDKDNRVYIVISAQSYPERLVFPLLNELVQRFQQEFGQASMTCTAGALDGRAKKLLVALAEEFDDPARRDRLAQVSVEVEKVQGTMCVGPARRAVARTDARACAGATTSAPSSTTWTARARSRRARSGCRRRRAASTSRRACSSAASAGRSTRRTGASSSPCSSSSSSSCSPSRP